MYQISKLFCLIPLVVFMSAQTSQAQEVKLQVRMGARDAIQAKAKYEQKGVRMKFNVQLEDAIPNTVYGVRIVRGGQEVGARLMLTNGFGVGTIDVDNTEGDNVARLQTGDIVQIWFNQRVILSGALR